MKELYVEDLYDYLDKEITGTFLVTELSDSMNRFSNRWQDGVLSDCTGNIPFKIWNENISEEYREYNGKVVSLIGKVTLYQDRYVVEVISLLPAENITDMADYVVMLSKDETNHFIRSIQNLIGRAAEDKPLFHLLNAVFTPQMYKKMGQCPGGNRYDSFVGGLLVHTEQVLSITADMIDRKQKSFYNSEFSPALAIAGAALHDISKVYEFEAFPSTKKNERGLLVNTATNSILGVNQVINAMKKEDRITDVTRLYHIILTASSSSDKESDLKPRTLEAIMVNLANKEAKTIDMYGKCMFDLERGFNSDKKFVWSKEFKRTLVR